MSQELHTPEYCLARAAQCETLAAQTPNRQSQITFLHLARRWRALGSNNYRGSRVPSRELSRRRLSGK